MICDKNKCTGCGLCSIVCPKQAITMVDDSEGFYYPLVNNDKCINCNLCKKKCPVLNHFRQNNCNPSSYMCWSLDNKNINESSSGGLFTEFANYFLNNNGVVVGCELTSTFDCKHIVVTKNDDLIKLKGSKYVQSNIIDVFLKIKDLLNNKINVLFVGCPCQVAAIKNFIGKSDKYLYTIDLVCHGVPSNSLFKTYINEIENKYKKKIINYRFRTKIKEWRKFFVQYIFDDGSEINKLAIEDEFMACYMKGAIYRESCYNCKFNGFPRIADITIGDYMGVNKSDVPTFALKNGVSSCIINNDKGNFLFNKISNNIYFKNVSIESFILTNKNITSSSSRPKCRDAIYDSSKPFIQRQKELCRFKFSSIFLNRYFSVNFQNFIKKVIKK